MNKSLKKFNEKLTQFFGFIPIFHNDTIQSFSVENNDIKITILTEPNSTNKYIFDKHENASQIHTSLTFKNVNRTATQSDIESILENKTLAKFIVQESEQLLFAEIIFPWGYFDQIFHCEDIEINITKQ